MFLLNGYIITSKKFKNEIAEFEQLNMNMSHLSTKQLRPLKAYQTFKNLRRLKNTNKLFKSMFNKLENSNSI